MQFPQLPKINTSLPIAQLDKETATEVQFLLKEAGLYKGSIDGIVGAGTLQGFARFKQLNYLEYPELIGKSTAEALLEVAGTTRPEPVEIPSESYLGKTLTLPYGRVVHADEPIIKKGHFCWGEATKGCTRKPQTSEITENIVRMAEYLDRVRMQLDDRPLEVTSWYRDPATNRAVGGAKNSTHQFGHGVDFNAKGLSPREVQQRLESFHHGGMGYGKTFTHIDLRGYKARWNYDA